VIGISQSGRSLEPSRVLEEARQQGAVMTLSITNDAESPLAQSADHHIALNAGAERSLAASKTYTAQLWRWRSGRRVERCVGVGRGAAARAGLDGRNVPDERAHARAAARYTFMSHCVTLARGSITAPASSWRSSSKS